MTKMKPIPFRNCRGALVVAALLLLTTLLMADSGKPSFAGHWELDKAKSDFGNGPAPDSIVETIDHKEPVLVITTVMKTARGEQDRTVKLTTDDAENSNLLSGHPVTTRTHWDGNKLVTVVKDPRGLQITEIRELSKDGRSQTVDIDSGFAKQKFVMVKK